MSGGKGGNGYAAQGGTGGSINPTTGAASAGSAGGSNGGGGGGGSAGGGAGGAGGATGIYGTGGTGGTGGQDGLVESVSVGANGSALTGTAGTAGQQGTPSPSYPSQGLDGSGGGGEGGYGLILTTPTSTTSFSNTGTLTGGAGGSGGPETAYLGNLYSTQAGAGDGGIALDILPATGIKLTNSGTLQGGNAGGYNVPSSGTANAGGGIGGAGLQGAGVTVIDSGTIAGGHNGDGTIGNALNFTGGINTLALSASNLLTGGIVVASGKLTFNQSVGNTFTSSLTLANVISGGGAIDLEGVNSPLELTLTGVNTYTGGTTVGYASILSVSADANLGAATGGLDIEFGTLDATAGFSSARGVRLGGMASIEVDGAGNTLALSGTVLGSGSLDKFGAGTLTLSGTNTYTGATAIYTGTLQAGSAQAFGASSAVTDNATLDLAGNNETIGALDGSTAGIVTNSGTAAATLTTGTLNQPDTFSGTIKNGSTTATTALTKVGTGTETLTGANTYTGTTTISAGTLQLGNGGTTGSIADNGAIVDNGALVADENASVILGAISGSGSLSVLSAGFSSSVFLTGAASYTGATTIAKYSNLFIEGSFTGTGAIADAGTFGMATGGNVSIVATITGAGSVEQQGPGEVTLASTNSYSGGTSILGGTLQAAAANAFGSGDVSFNPLASNATLDLAGFSETVGALTSTAEGSKTSTVTNSGTAAATLSLGNTGESGTFAGTIQDGSVLGTLALTKAGAGIETLSGTNSYSAGTTLAAGELVVSADANLGAASGALTFTGGTLDATAGFTSARGVTLNSAGTVEVDGAGTTLALSGVVADGAGGAGSLTKTGTGTLTLSGANTYSGTTTLSAGTLELGQATSAGSGAITFGVGSQTLQIDAAADGFTNTLNTLHVGDALDLRGLGFATGAAASVSGNTLTVISGDSGEAFTLSGNASANFSVTSDGHTGTLVTEIAAVAPTIANSSMPAASTNETPVTPFANASLTDTNDNSTANDTLTIAVSGDNGGALSEGSGYTDSGTLNSTGANIYTLTGTGAAITAELQHLVFTPNPGAANTASTTTFTLSDTSTAGGPSNTDATSQATDTDPAVAPTITNDSAARSVTSETPVMPFGGATVGDSNAAAGSTTAGTATDTLTITLSGGNGGTLGDQPGFEGSSLTPAGANTYTLTGTGAAITAELEQLSFTPNAGAANTASTTTFALSDTSTAGGASNTNATSQVTDTDPAVAPTIANTSSAQATTSETPVLPFGGAKVSDTNAAANSNAAGTATDTLTITLSGGTGGTLSEGANFAGTSTLTPAGASNSYTLSGTGAAITAELDQLSFTPNAGVAGTSATTTFTLSDTSTVGGASNTDTASMVTDTDPALAPMPAPVTPTPVTPAPVTPAPVTPAPVSPAPVITTPAPSAPVTVTTPPAAQAVTPDAVTIDPNVTYSRGTFALSGTASSAVGVKSVEISAVLDDGSVKDLGAATVNANGTFTFADTIGSNQQGFITATETDAAGGKASGGADYSLTGGLSLKGGETARQTRYTDGGNAEAAVDLFKPDGSQTAKLFTPGQSFTSAFFDTFNNGGAPESSFVFDPGHGLDVVNLFRVGGVDHDTLSFTGSDFGATPASQLAAVLQNTHNAAGGAVVTDPTSHDTVKLTGVTKAQLAANKSDFAFHA